MLNIENCQEYFNQVKQFAIDNNLLENFEKTMNYLDTYAEGEERGKTRCKLYKDFAPNSFEFVMERRCNIGEYHFWFNGGAIFYSAGENGVSGPQYTVRLDCEKSGWSIHT
jgi:hypothetical protein